MQKVPNARVLIVDDSPEMIELMTSVVRRIGLDATPALSGEVALERVQQTAFDLILLDNNMPGLSGLQVCERLKAERRTWGIPVIFVTANHTHAFRAEAQRLGAVNVVSKPFGMLELLQVILLALKWPIPANATLESLLLTYGQNPPRG